MADLDEDETSRFSAARLANLHHNRWLRRNGSVVELPRDTEQAKRLIAKLAREDDDDTPPPASGAMSKVTES